MTYKVKALIDFNDKDEKPVVKRIANKSIWEIKDKQRVDFLLEKGAIEILPEIEPKKEKKTSRERKKDKFML
nr:MAG TPA: hypothetical protein [Caudoviricetes sp.]